MRLIYPRINLISTQRKEFDAMSEILDTIRNITTPNCVEGKQRYWTNVESHIIIRHDKELEHNNTAGE